MLSIFQRICTEIQTTVQCRGSFFSVCIYKYSQGNHPPKRIASQHAVTKEREIDGMKKGVRQRKRRKPETAQIEVKIKNKQTEKMMIRRKGRNRAIPNRCSDGWSRVPVLGPIVPLSVFRLLPSDWPQRVMRNKQVEASHQNPQRVSFVLLEPL